MHTILDLIPVSRFTEDLGKELFAQDPESMMRDCQKIADEIPNFQHFLIKVRETYDASISNAIWFRVWSEIKCEERMGVNLTLPLLRRMSHYDDRPVELKREVRGKIITHCFKVLHALISTADPQYEQTA